MLHISMCRKEELDHLKIASLKWFTAAYGFGGLKT